MVMEHYLFLKNKEDGDLFKMLRDAGILHEMDGKYGFFLYDLEAMHFRENFPQFAEDVRKTWAQVEVDDYGRIRWIDGDDSLSVFAKQISEKMEGTTLDYYAGYYDMSGQYHTNADEVVLNGKYIDPNGKPCAKHARLWKDWVTKDEEHGKILFNVPLYHGEGFSYSNEFSLSDYFEREDEGYADLYLREDPKIAYTIDNYTRDYFAWEEYEMMMDWEEEEKE